MLIFRCTHGTLGQENANLIRFVYNPIYLMAANTPAYGKRNKLKTLRPERVARSKGPQDHRTKGPMAKRPRLFHKRISVDKCPTVTCEAVTAVHWIMTKMVNIRSLGKMRDAHKNEINIHIQDHRKESVVRLLRESILVSSEKYFNEILNANQYEP